jgi:hypothetical protein
MIKKTLTLLTLLFAIGCKDNGPIEKDYLTSLGIVTNNTSLVHRKTVSNFQDYTEISFYTLPDSSAKSLKEQLDGIASSNNKSYGWEKVSLNFYKYKESDSAHRSEYYINAWFVYQVQGSMLTLNEYQW